MKNATRWSWNPAAVPAELHALLDSFGEIFPIERGSIAGHELKFEHIAADGLVSEVVFEPGGAVIRYNQLCAAGRGVGSALAGIAGRESTPFTMIGIMLDLSRNLVFTVPALKKLFQRLALLGYNTVFLYCEDTYELPGEPCFGMMRGRYTAAEIRTADDIAAGLGIELIGCIQTLGHMAQALRWTTAYAKIRDTASVMMVDAPETAALIAKMLDFWQANLRSRRIHVGMDETHDLGRGRYLDQKGYVNGFELFNRQLEMVNAACCERGLAPMIWSDMFFRLGNPNQSYYDLNSVIPDAVKKRIPENMRLVYWDYYCVDQDFYEKFIAMHRELGSEPLMGAGVWIWSRLWYDAKWSAQTNRACLGACRKMGLKEIFFTMWGDDGAICHFDSAWTGLTEASDLCFGIDDAAVTAKRYQALTGSDYELNRLPGLLHRENVQGSNTDMAIFWDDLLLGLGWHNLIVADPKLPESLIEEYQMILDRLAPHRDDCGGGNLDYAWRLTAFLLAKLIFRKNFVAAYAAQDRALLAELQNRALPELVRLFDEFTAAFRAQWLANGKVFGLETMQHRMGGQRERLLETGRRIGEYLNGQSKLPELEEPYAEKPERMAIYCDMASGSVMI